jgi:hypothetical protein
METNDPSLQCGWWTENLLDSLGVLKKFIQRGAEKVTFALILCVYLVQMWFVCLTLYISDFTKNLELYGCELLSLFFVLWLTPCLFYYLWSLCLRLQKKLKTNYKKKQ